MYLWISLMFHSKVKKGTESHFLKTGNFVETFRDWCSRSCPHLNTAKTKEIVMAFRRSRPFQSSVSIHGQDTEVVYSYKYLRVLLKDKRPKSTDSLYKKGQCHLVFLQLLRFLVCDEILNMHLIILWWPVLCFNAAVCWGPA